MWKNQEWLDSGGAEIVLEVVRCTGWTVEVCDAETWEFLPDIVSFGNRDDCLVSVNGVMPPWLQAVAVVATSHSTFKKLPGSSYRDGILPFFITENYWTNSQFIKSTDSLIESGLPVRQPLSLWASRFTLEQ